MQSDMPGCEMDLRLRYRLTLVSGMVECLCFAGVLFGYASLVFVLKEEGYFRQQCDTAVSLNASDCAQQDEKFSLVFTVASFLNNFLTLFNGYVFDRFGTLVTRLLGISLYTTGTLLISFSSAGISEVLFPALSCIAVGGMLLLLSNMQVGNLFAAHRSTIITLYNGAFDSSAAIFLILKVLHEHGVPLYSSFHVLSVCSVVHLVRTFLLLPRTRIPYPLPQSYSYGVTCAKSDSYNVEHLGTETDAVTPALQSGEAEAEEEVVIEDTLNVRSFWSCVLSWLFARHLVWLSIMQLRHYLFIGTLNPMLNRLGGNDPDLVSQYTNAFAITQLCGVLCAPWNGLIMDRHKGKPLAPGDTEQEADLRSSSLSLLLTAVQCLLFSVCASIPLLKLQYITFILQVLNRSFLYGGNAAFISVAFPASHFGKLYGLVMSMSAVFSLLQYPCFALIKGPLGGDPLIVDVTLTLLTLVVFIHPICVFFHCRQGHCQMDASQAQDTS